MVRLDNRPINRFITITAGNSVDLDKYGQEISDIIDAYGGSNPYPRLLLDNGLLVYSFTTKIGKDNIEEFDKELDKWRGGQ